MASDRAGTVPHQPEGRVVPLLLGRGLSLLLALLAALFYAGALFYLWRSFREDYPELQFDLRALAVLLFGYGSLFAASAWALWHDRVRLWLPLAAFVGFLLPFLFFSFLSLYYTVSTGEFHPESLFRDLRTFYGPPFTLIHAVLYGCLALALLTMWWYRRARRAGSAVDR